MTLKSKTQRDSGLLRLMPAVLVTAILFAGCQNKEEKPAETRTSKYQNSLINPPGSRGYDAEMDNEIFTSRQSAITRAVQKASPAVVSISVTGVRRSEIMQDPFFNFFWNPGIMQEYTSLGSGFIISPDGHVITNEHVVGRNSVNIQVALGDGRTYDATLIGRDEYADLALIKINSTEELPYVEFGNSDDLMVGEWAIAMGNPFGLFEDGQPSVTVGVISALKRDFRPNPQDPRVYLNMIQTDAAINRGNSGGPLLNSYGEVIGINTFIYTGGTSYGFVGLGFAIPSNTVIRILNMLVESGEVQLDFDSGLEWTPNTRGLAMRYNLPTIQGLFVVSVNRDGPAFEAGILPGDLILRIGFEPIYSENHAWALLREYNEGDVMRIELLRNGRRYETEMQLRKKVAGTVK